MHGFTRSAKLPFPDKNVSKRKLGSGPTFCPYALQTGFELSSGDTLPC